MSGGKAERAVETMTDKRKLAIKQEETPVAG